MTGFWKKSLRSLVLLSFVSVQLQGGVALAASSRAQTTSSQKRKASSAVKGKRVAQSKAARVPQAQGSKWHLLNSDSFAIGSRDIAVQNYERVVHMGDLDIPVASISHTVQPQPTNRRARLSPQRVAEEMRKAIGLPPWVTSKRGDISVFVSDNKAANRYITLFYREHNGLVSISVSSIRRVFILPVLAETEMLQKELARGIDQLAPGQPEKSASLWDHALEILNRVQAEKLLPEAEAQVPGVSQQGILDLIARVPDNGAATDLLNKYYNQLGSSSNLGNIFSSLQLDLSKFNNLPADLRDIANRGQNQIDRFQGQIDRGQGQVDRALNIGQQTVDVGRDAVNTANRGIDVAQQQSDKMISAAQQISKETNQTIRDVSRETNENARKIADKMTSFETAFIMGLGGAMGAAVGTMVVNVVVSAGTWAIKSLWNAIFGLIDEDTRKQINANTADGLNQLERQTKNITAIEIELDKNIAALAFATGHNAENLAELAGAMSLKNQVAAEIETTKLKNGMRAQMGIQLRPGEDAGVPDDCAFTANRFKALAAGYSTIAPVLAAAAAEGGPAGVRNKICRDIANLLVSWQGAEAELQVARGMVLDGMKVMMDETASKAFRSTDPLASDRRTRIACESKVGDMKDQAEKFDHYDCSSKPVGTPECEPYHRSMASIAYWERMCQQVDEASRSRNYAVDFMYVTEGLSHQMNQAKLLYDKLARANCPAAQCGEDGEFSKLRQRYRALLGKAKSLGCQLPFELEDQGYMGGGQPGGPQPALTSAPAPAPAPGRVGQPIQLYSSGGTQSPQPNVSSKRFELIYGDHMSYR